MIIRRLLVNDSGSDTNVISTNVCHILSVSFLRHQINSVLSTNKNEAHKCVRYMRYLNVRQHNSIAKKIRS